MQILYCVSSVRVIWGCFFAALSYEIVSFEIWDILDMNFILILLSRFRIICISVHHSGHLMGDCDVSCSSFSLLTCSRITGLYKKSFICLTHSFQILYRSSQLTAFIMSCWIKFIILPLVFVLCLSCRRCELNWRSSGTLYCSLLWDRTVELTDLPSFRLLKSFLAFILSSI